MNKDERIYEFLKFFSDIMIQNPNYNLTENNIYNELIFLGVNNSRNIIIPNLFDEWVDYFEKSDNINVFIEPQLSGFCQFKNISNNFVKYNNHIKVYIPLDLTHINKGAKLIFEYLNFNNIHHSSKIAKRIRFDNIVVRLVNEDDLKKLLYFLNKNNYIQEGLIESNPFAFSKDRISMVCDGCLSYNAVIASYILLYLNNKKKEKTLSDVNVNEFYRFIENYYQNNFINLNKFKILNDFDSHFEGEKHEDVFKDLNDVTSLIIKSRDVNFSLDDYIEHFNSTLDSILQKENKNNFRLDEIMKYIIKTCYDRDENIIIIKNRITNYIKTGDKRWLTRSNNLRNYVVKTDYRNKLLLFFKKLNIDINTYLEYIIDKYGDYMINDADTKRRK